jgi:hypothetical protein
MVGAFAYSVASKNAWLSCLVHVPSSVCQKTKCGIQSCTIFNKIIIIVYIPFCFIVCFSNTCVHTTPHHTTYHTTLHAHFFLKHQKYQYILHRYKRDCPTPYRSPCFILSKKLETNQTTNDAYHHIQHHIVFVKNCFQKRLYYLFSKYLHTCLTLHFIVSRNVKVGEHNKHNKHNKLANGCLSERLRTKYSKNEVHGMHFAPYGTT